MTTVTGQGGTARSKQGLDERGRSAKTPQSEQGGRTVDSQAPSLTYHINEERRETSAGILCPRHADPRDTSVADPASAPCTCDCVCGHRVNEHDVYGCKGLLTFYDDPTITGPEPVACWCEAAR
jgi:hypothetical protein